MRSEIGKFAIVPLWVLEKPISAQAVRAYATLAAKWADRNTGECSPSHATLGKAMQTSTSTARRAVDELEKVGAVEVEPRFNGGEQSSNVTTILQVDPCPQVNDPCSPMSRPLFTGEQTPVHRRATDHNQEPESVNQINRPTLLSFDAFWDAYPNRQKRKQAEEIWAKLAPPDQLDAIDGAFRFAKSAEYADKIAENTKLGRPKNKYVVGGDQFLKHRRWEDEFTPTETIDTGGFAE